MSIEEEKQTKTRRRQGGRRVRARGLGGIAVFDARLLILSLLSLSLLLLPLLRACAMSCVVCVRPQSSPPTRVLRCSKFPNSVFFWGGRRGQISPNFDLKNMISPYTKDFSSLDFKEFFFLNRQILKITSSR